MAGDEKHVRKHIDNLRLRVANSGIHDVRVNVVTEDLEAVLAALEAALPGDDDWEYAMRESGEDEPWSYTHPTRELLLSAVGWMAKRQDMEIVRRRPAGPWEPVEEVPRG
ncbi:MULTISPECIES: hypothetical protein [unclassified Leucobacter]|uniref:hypothetical protein n=1 Tax=unclassified Leucobacter TaxID=2621730 RepID=UPI00062292AE|nr:hypothetical protein [Leucobacter sp. Ag1]KKI18731.1 hypothetical protein XM48_10650 [Leucobacter sp. Ag1]